MTKRRVTLNLDEEVVEALESVQGRSLSDTANRALREAAAAIGHRRALLGLLDELDARLGPPTESELAEADLLLDAIFGSVEHSGVA